MFCVVTMHGNTTEETAGGGISFLCKYAISCEGRERLGQFSRRPLNVVVVFQNEFEKHLSGVDTASFPQAGEGLTNLTRSLSFKTGSVFSVILWSLTETTYLGNIWFSWEQRPFFCAAMSTAIPHLYDFTHNNCQYYLLQWKALHVSTGMFTQHADCWKTFSEPQTLILSTDTGLQHKAWAWAMDAH